MDIELAKIRKRYNPRREFNAEALAELAESIKKNGLIQPITVSPRDEGGYWLIAGERRLRAHELLGLDEIQANVLYIDAAGAADITDMENLARVDLNPIEECAIFSRRVAAGQSVPDIAKALGVSETLINNRLALAGLRDDIKSLIASGNMTVGYAAVLGRANLDTNRQLIAIRRLESNPAPTLSWFAKTVGELENDQRQGAFAFGDFSNEQIVVEKIPLPALPSKDDPPTSLKSGLALIDHYAQFWSTQANKWKALGRRSEERECRAAAKSLKFAVERVRAATF